MARALDAPGEVTLTAMDDEQDRAALHTIYEQMRNNDRVWVENIPAMYVDDTDRVLNTVSMQFRYPPMPPEEGFNVFGDISHLEIQSALGNLDADGQEFEMKTSSKLALDGMTRPSFKRGVLSVPIKTNAADVEFSIDKVSRLKVNGQSKNTLARTFGIKTEYELAILALTLITAILTVGLPHARAKD
jgi:hypothetical protein